MNDAYDVAKCEAFRQAWRITAQPALEDFLPPDEDPRRLATLLQIVRIDMEMRYGGTAPDSQPGLETLPGPVSVDEYVSRFADLQSAEMRQQLDRQLSEIASSHHAHGTWATACEDPQVASQSTTQNIDDAAGPRYQVLQEYARGGMGVVWRVFDRKLGREIALKRLNGDLATNAVAKERFINEARITAQLEHPGIVPIYDLSGLENDEPNYTMKLLRGETLTAAIERYHSLAGKAPERSVMFARLLDHYVVVCQAIAYAHDRGIIHRDLKPDNVLLGAFGETAVLDWGLAKLLHETAPKSGDQATQATDLRDGQWGPLDVISQATRQGTVMGTPAYMAPEQARGETVSAASDVYALGTMLYQVLVGRPPFRANTLKDVLLAVVEQTPQQPREIAPEISPALEAICLKAMEKKPDERFDTAAALVAEVERFLADQPIHSYHESASERAFRWMRQHRQIVLGTMAILIIAAISTIAYSLVSQANQASQFAEQKRVDQARASAESAAAVAVQRMQNGDFDSAAVIFDEAREHLAGQPALSTLQKRIDAQQGRAKQLAEFTHLQEQVYHYAVTQQKEQAYSVTRRCLESLGVEEDPEWWLALPDDELTEHQARQLKEQTYGLFLQLAAIHGDVAYTAYAIHNAQASLFNTTTTPAIQAKAQVARRYLDQAEAYRPTTAADYLGLIIKQSNGDMPLLKGIGQWLALEPREPESAVDCFYTAVVYATSQPLNENFGVWVQAAKMLGSDTKLQDAEQEAERLFLKAIRLDPNYYPALFLSGMTTMQKGNFAAAQQAFNACIQLNPNAAEAYVGRAGALLVRSVVEQDEARKAELITLCQQDLDRTLELAPHNGYLRKEIGSLKCLAGEYEVGIEHLLVGLDLSNMRFTGQALYRQAEKEALLNNMLLQGDLGAAPELVALYQATVSLDYGDPLAAWEFLHQEADASPANASSRWLTLGAQTGYTLLREPPTGKVKQPVPEVAELLRWADRALVADPSSYRARFAQVSLLLLDEQHALALEAIEEAQRAGDTLATWQQVELQALKSQALRALGRNAEAESAIAAAKEISEIYYDSVLRE